MKCPHCGKDTDTGLRVLVVHSSEQMVGLIREFAGVAQVEQVKTGREALWLLSRERFSMVIVDVAASDPYAFELVPELKKIAGLRVLLLASVFDKTAYKRRPSSLHGADDYLEQHHLPDKLPLVLAKLTSSEAPAELSEAQLLQKREALRVAAGEVLDVSRPMTTQFSVDGDQARVALRTASAEELSTRARELARKLLLDISLYNGEEFRNGVRSRDLAERLKQPIDDAKRFLADRIPSPMTARDAAAYIDEAVDELLGGGA